MVRGVACRWRVIFVVSISSLNNEEFSNGHIVPCAVGGCEFLDNVPKYVALWRDAQAAGAWRVGRRGVGGPPGDQPAQRSARRRAEEVVLERAGAQQHRTHRKLLASREARGDGGPAF